MNATIKKILEPLLDKINECRGYRFPDYFHFRDKLDVIVTGIEPDVSNILRTRLRKGMTVLDVGGNVGLISRICSTAVGSTGKVVAFEPDPYTRGFLEYNTRNCGNVTVSPIALSDENTKAQFHIHPGSGTSNSLVEISGAKDVFDVDCMTMDSYLEENPELKPEFIKIDVEGAELRVLKGMERTISASGGLFLIMEFCPENLANGGVSSADLYSKITDMGFAVEVIDKNGNTTRVNSLAELLREIGSKPYVNILCTKR